jgi:hypothetical protein
MKEKEERKYRRGVLVEKKRRRGGLGQKAIFFPWLAPRTEVGGLGRRRPTGERGKRRRATRGFFSLPHLGLGCAVEAGFPPVADWRWRAWGAVLRCSSKGRRWPWWYVAAQGAAGTFL